MCYLNFKSNLDIIVTKINLSNLLCTNRNSKKQKGQTHISLGL